MDPPARDRWASRFVFIIAAVGAAVGLGNVWRFPYMTYKYGGGTFLIPFIIFLIFTGLPLMTAELALGRLFQKGDIEAFGAIHPRARGAGVISTIGGFSIVVYYSVIIAWAAIYFCASFSSSLPWDVDECAVGSECSTDPSQALLVPAADKYFWTTVQRYNPRNVEKGTATIIAGPVFGALLFAWVACYFCIFKGVKSVGHAAKLTVLVPWALLIIMLIYNLTLEGAGDGIVSYIGEWNYSVLSNGAVWSDAAGQVFFTLGCTIGIMSAYASFAPRTTDMFANSNWIGWLDCLTSVVAGFVVFAILGHLAHQQNKTVAINPELRFSMCIQAQADESCLDYDCDRCRTDAWSDDDASTCCGHVSTDDVTTAGLSLAFVVYPAVMTTLGQGTAQFFSLCWFGCLFLLGIDSMFAMVEGVSTVITDTPRFAHLRREKVAAVACAIGFLVSIAFATDIGVALLDAADHYIITCALSRIFGGTVMFIAVTTQAYALFITGAVEAYVVSWVWGWKETEERTGIWSTRLLTYGYTVFSLTGCVIGGTTYKPLAAGVNIALGIGIGVGGFLICCALAFLVRKNKDDTFMTWLGIWSLAGTRNLRKTFKVDPSPTETTIHIIAYDLPIKYICPPALIALFINSAVNDAEAYDNGYENYPNWLHIVSGVLFIGLMIGSLIFFVVWPGFWTRVSGPVEAGSTCDSGKPMDEDKDTAGASNVNLLMQTEAFDDWGKRLPPKKPTLDAVI